MIFPVEFSLDSGLGTKTGSRRCIPATLWFIMSLGRDKPLHAFDRYTELKLTWIRLRA